MPPSETATPADPRAEHDALLPCPFCGGAAFVFHRGEAACKDESCAGWTLTRCTVSKWNARPAPPDHARALREALIARTVQGVHEWDDRTSPEDWPDALLITGDELATLLRDFAAALAAPEPEEPADA